MMGNEYGCIDEYPNDGIRGMPIKWAKAKNQGDLEDDGRRLGEHRAMQRRCRQLKTITISQDYPVGHPGWHFGCIKNRQSNDSCFAQL